MCILTREQVAEMDIKACEHSLAELNKQYPFNQKLTKKVLPLVDAVVNTLLYLEDRIQEVKQLDNLTLANQIRWSTK